MYLNTNAFYSLIGEDRNLLTAVRLSDYFNRPTIIEKGYNLDHLSRGLTTQSQEEVDPFFTSEVRTNDLRVLNRPKYRIPNVTFCCYYYFHLYRSQTSCSGTAVRSVAT